jgi:hypothetical protein
MSPSEDLRQIKADLNQIIHRITGDVVSPIYDEQDERSTEIDPPQSVERNAQTTTVSILNILNLVFDLASNIIRFFKTRESKDDQCEDVWADYSFAHRKMQQRFDDFLEFWKDPTTTASPYYSL